ncbi:MAG: glycosyltransferase family 4 protein [Bdellovibrionota bacterium]
MATNLGGAEKSLLELLAEIRGEKRISILVLLPQTTGPLINELEGMGITYSVIPMPGSFLKVSRSTPLLSLLNAVVALPAMFSYLRSVRKFFQYNEIDIIHTTGLKCHALAMLATLGQQTRVVWHIRDIFSAGPVRLGFACLSRIFRHRLTLIANSKATSISVSGKLRPIVIYNGINSGIYKAGHNNAFAEELGIDSDIPVVGLVGVLARWKGQVEFIRMAKLLKERGVAAKFVIVGDQIYDTAGDQGYAQELKNMVKSFGLEADVFFSGFRKDIVAVLSGLTVLVHGSVRAEPFGRVIVEAQSCGVPVVASAAGGVLEIVEDQRTGLLYEMGNYSAMADCVERLLRDSLLRERMALAAKARVESEFSIQNHAGRILGIYAEGMRNE